MKFVLASQGLTTPEIAKAISDLVSKPLNEINTAVINEAYVANKPGFDQKWLLNELDKLTEHIKGTVAFVNLRAYGLEEVKQRLESADLIYIVGGAQIILPQLFRQTGFDKLLKDLAESKTIMGTSAGANVLGAQIKDPDYWQDQYGSSEEYLANPALGLVDFNILPHYGREDHSFRNAERITPLLKSNPFPLYALNDEQAVIYNNGGLQFVGGEPVVFGQS